MPAWAFRLFPTRRLAVMRRALGVRSYQPLERHMLVAGRRLQQHDSASRDTVAEPHESGPEPAVGAGSCQQLGVAGECPRPQLPFEILKRS